ncbi:MAG TPA: hypothetical protein VGH16_07745 [Candidatus Binatia bacterium]|jgi:hypothetical protein
MFKFLLNSAFRTAHWFDDGSRLDYIVPGDIIRYLIRSENKKAYIPLMLAPLSGKLRLKDSSTWRWRDPATPPQQWSDSGPPMTENERAELRKKLKVLFAKKPKKFEGI